MDRYRQNKINEKLKVIMLQNIKKVEQFYLQKKESEHMSVNSYI